MPNLPEHLALGVAGEDAAFFELRRKGYTVVARRWASGDVPGDIDLIAWQGPMLCFIEVKARAHDRAALESVGARQRARIERAASLYVAGKPALARKGMRFDIITVAPFPRHIRDAWRP